MLGRSRRCANISQIFTVFSNIANHSLWLKRFKRTRPEIKLQPLVGRALFASVNSPWMRKFFFFLVASWKNCQQRVLSRWALFICIVLCLINLLARTVFPKYLLSFFSRKLTSVSMQILSFEEIPSSQNSDTTALFSPAVVKISSSL